MKDGRGWRNESYRHALARRGIRTRGIVKDLTHREMDPDSIHSSAESGNTALIIQYDIDPESPRDWDNLGTMVCWHSRYNLGDGHHFDTPDDFHEEIDKDDAIIIPLYLYDHSGLAMRTTSFNDLWDSGQVGYIYVTDERIRKEYDVKKITKEIREEVRNVLKSEVGTYDQHISGNVYGFQLYEDGEFTDSCYGFYGDDWEKNGMKEHIPEIHHHLFDKLK